MSKFYKKKSINRLKSIETLRSYKCEQLDNLAVFGSSFPRWQTAFKIIQIHGNRLGATMIRRQLFRWYNKRES